VSAIQGEHIEPIGVTTITALPIQLFVQNASIDVTDAMLVTSGDFNLAELPPLNSLAIKTRPILRIYIVLKLVVLGLI